MNNRITKTLRGKAGFTLVELIVVIAILGILAGVGTVGYSGYIKKANMAADQTLLSSLNTAYAVACIENGEDAVGTDAEDITISNGVVTADDIEVNSPAAKADVIQESFEKYYEGGTFKVMTALKFVGGVFVDADSSSNMFSSIFSSLSDSLSTYVTKVNDSAFGDIGAETLMNQVDDVTGLVAALFGRNSTTSENLLNALTTDDDISAIAEAVGMTTEQLLLLGDDDFHNIVANYAVLKVAGTVSTTDTSTWLTELQNGMSTDDIKNMLASDESESSQEGVAKAAMMYAMYTAYASDLEGDEKTAAEANLASIDAFVSAIGTETQEGTGFMQYLSDTSAETDMAGFIASMNIITTSTSESTEATGNLLLNGYSNADLISALQTLLEN